MKPFVLVLNCALARDAGNTAVLLRSAAAVLRPNARVSEVTLGERTRFSAVLPALRRADAIIVGTGTYWDSWSHHLQRFLEEATATEGTAVWLGKPVGVIVTMHSVGGKGVLSRLQGVLNTLGAVIPPMSGLVYSLVNQSALAASTERALDVWSPEDVETICHNVLASLKPRPRYRTWPVDRADAAGRWIKPAADMKRA